MDRHTTYMRVCDRDITKDLFDRATLFIVYNIIYNMRVLYIREKNVYT